MRNWAGQQIEPRAVVWRGARDGNTSSFKIGIVEKIDEGKGNARVRWLFEHRHMYATPPIGSLKWQAVNGPRPIDTTSTCTVQALCVVDPLTLDLGVASRVAEVLTADGGEL